MTRSIRLGLGALALLAAGCGSKEMQLVDPTARSGSTYDAAGDPTAFIPYQAAVMYVMVDGTRVYWATAQPGMDSPPAFFKSCLKDDCSRTAITYRTADGRGQDTWYNAPIQSVALDAYNVYWIETHPAKLATVDSSLRSCPIEGCPSSAPEGIVLAEGISASSLIADGEFVYWASSGDTGIFRCTAAGCPEGPKSVALTQANPISLAIGGDFVFWIAQSGPASFDIMRAPKDGGAPPAIFMAGQNRTDSLTVHGDWVYWTNAYSVGTVLRCPITGCGDGPAVVADSQPYPHAIVADGTQAFWTNLPGGTNSYDAELMKCSVEGCVSGAKTVEPNVLLWGWATNTLAVDDRYIYWVTMTENDMYGAFPNAAVHRAPK